MRQEDSQGGASWLHPDASKDQGSLNKAALGTRVLEGRWIPLYHGLGMRVVLVPWSVLRTPRFPVLSLLSLPGRP